MTTLWERLVDVLPELGPRLQQLRVNRARYRKIADTGKTADVVVGGERGTWGAGECSDALLLSCQVPRTCVTQTALVLGYLGRCDRRG